MCDGELCRIVVGGEYTNTVHTVCNAMIFGARYKVSNLIYLSHSI